jgi:hypothetical protein
MCLQFGFVMFWRKDFGAKAAHKMLVKLTPGLHLQQENFWFLQTSAFTQSLYITLNSVL